MSNVFLKVCLILICGLSFSAMKAQKSEDSRFLFSCEYYEEGAKHFDGAKYLSMKFEVTSYKKRGKQRYVARLKKGIASEGYKSGFGYKYQYYETGEPETTQKQYYFEYALPFFECHSIRFSLNDGQLVIENADSLQAALSGKVKVDFPVRPSAMDNNFLTVSGMREIFQHLFITLPDDLTAPGEMSLEKGVVYNYLENCNELKHVEVTDNKKHEKLNLFVSENSKIIRFKQIQRLYGQMIVRVLPTNEEANTKISGQFSGKRNETLQFNTESISLLDPKQKITVQTDAAGKFSFGLNLSSPVTIHCGSGSVFYAEPGDDFSFTSNSKQDSLRFFGIGAGNNNFLQAEWRFEKLHRPNNQVKDEQTQKAWFQKTDQVMNNYFNLIQNYRNDLSPCFYETQYLNYYYGKVNKKIEYIFSWYTNTDIGINKRIYAGLDTIPTRYQSFVFNREFNKYLENSFLMQFERLRDFTHIHNFESPEKPSDKELIRLASLAYSGKILRDYLEYVAPRVFDSNNKENIDALKEIIQEQFANSKLQTIISSLQKKVSVIIPGNLFPAIKFQDINGKTVELSQFKGKVIYLMFWRNEALEPDQQWKDYQNLIEEIKNDKVLIVTVGLEEDFEKWKLYVDRMNLKGLNLFLNRKSDDFKNYILNLKSRHFLLIDSTGKIVNNDGPDPSVASVLINQNMGSSNPGAVLLGLLTGLISTILFFGVIWYFVRLRQKRKAKIDSLLNRLRETELKAIKAQMNPHFLFNSLNSIQNLINQQKIEAANMYLSKFARLLRAVLQHSEKEFVPLADEIETLKLYVQLEKLRFNFDFQLNVSSDLDIYNTYIPPLLLQPFIENAILHGLQPKEGDKKLQIDIDEQEKQLVCRISDNGVGRNASNEQSQSHHGMGNKLSLERINLLNQKNNSKFMLRIDDGLPAVGGTQVTINFTNNLI